MHFWKVLLFIGVKFGVLAGTDDTSTSIDRNDWSAFTTLSVDISLVNDWCDKQTSATSLPEEDDPLSTVDFFKDRLDGFGSNFSDCFNNLLPEEDGPLSIVDFFKERLDGFGSNFSACFNNLLQWEFNKMNYWQIIVFPYCYSGLNLSPLFIASIR